VLSASVRLAQELVRIDTVNPPGRESLAAQVIAQRLAPLGVRIEMYDLSPGRASLVARYRESESVPSLCFSGHLDTVPLGIAAWSRHPHGGEIADGKLSAEVFDKAFAETPKAFYFQAEKDLDGCLASLKSLDELCDEKFGSEGPALGRLKTSIEEVRHSVHAMLEKKRETEPDPVEVVAAADGGAGTVVGCDCA